MSQWRVQWRNRTPGGNPGRIEFVDGDLEDAVSKVNELLNRESDRAPAGAQGARKGVCWLWIEDLGSNHKGNSESRPKSRGRR